MATATKPKIKSKPHSFRKFLEELREELFGNYHPEKHFMRGAGPKCHEKTERKSCNR